ncbi:LOW QUALITY PROTEIN: tetraspanin-3-like [Oxyura jamaicensis]|uniref:LOW QUALITY PROTEIN: tetraspanin-3-like n=1 Tax=Oxyura jamaicensis TaxID=8884 RepID=UPI0015A56626|nr:LOW QUALITY PROTEIN: tetraspanin-3-like [Oxyura jamaicensis]
MVVVRAELLGLSTMKRIRMVVLSLWGYEDSWLRSFARSLLMVIGFLFLGCAVALAFGGFFVILLCKNYQHFFQETFLSLPGWLAVVAALVLLPTGILAVSISTKSSRYQQGAFMHLLLILLCLQVSSAVLAQLYSIRMATELKSTMGHLFYEYNGTHSQAPGSRAVDVVQKRLWCCGVQNYTDWLKTVSGSWHLLAEKARVPGSCCKEKYSVCRGELHHLEQLFQEGCLRKLEDRLHFAMLYLFCCCTVLLVLELLAGASNGILMRHQPFHNLRILDSSTF